MLIKPIITEKSLRLAQKGQFSFLVSRQATKPQIKTLVEKTFKVKVVKVRRSRAKAIVALKSGEMIKYFELPEKKTKKKRKKKL